jgi:hypothetical protein
VAASAPSSSRVIQLEPSDLVLSERLCEHLIRSRSKRIRAPNAETERGKGAKEPGKKNSPFHLLLPSWASGSPLL